MATTTFTITDPGLFPAGTTVKAYPASNWIQATLPPSGAPVGAATAEVTIGPGGSGEFTGLTEKTRYYAAAEVGGMWRYVAFSIRPRPSSGISQAEVEALIAGGAAEGPAGPVGMNWRGIYSNATTYAKNDAVSYNGSAFIATAGTTGVNPGTPGVPGTNWTLLSEGSPIPASVSPNIIPAAMGAPTSGALVVNTLYLASIFVPNPVTLTGVVWGNNMTVAGNVIASLYNASLARVAVTASVAVANAFATQAKAFEAAYPAAAGVYYVGIQASSVSSIFNKRELMGPWGAQAQGSFVAPSTINALSVPGTGNTAPEVATY